MEQTHDRLVHWYDVEARRIACGAPGLSGSTKHGTGVTCSACLALLAESRAAGHVDTEPPAPLH